MKAFFAGVVEKVNLMKLVAGNENFSLPNMSYDKNGNISNLQRNGKVGAGFGQIDNLQYNYSGNRLTSVADNTGGVDHEVDFVPRGNGTYTYWEDGSLRSDANKEISNISYDTYLKKPTQVQLTNNRWIKMYYDGSGKLFKREFSTGEYWEFVGDLIFKNGQFFSMNTPDGRAVYESNSWVYEFFIQDHLGNTRVAFRANGNQLQKTSETAFDPTGIELLGVGQNSLFENRFKHQNKESLALFGLSNIEDFGARYLDKSIMRWWGVDEMAELAPGLTPYRYSFNNPVNVIDPDGNYEARNGDVNFEYSDGYGTLSSRNSTGSVEFSGAYQNKGQDGCPDPPCNGGYGGGDPSTPYDPSIPKGHMGRTYLSQGRSRLRPEIDDAAVLGVDMAGIVEAPLALWKGGIKLLSSFKAMLTGSEDIAKSSSSVLNFSTKQLQAKFKHAADFGVTGNWNKAAASRFNSAINQHINSATVKTIQGTYRGQQVIHSLDPKTGLNVISSPSGQFISGWKLNPAQLQNVIKHGGL